MSAARGAEVGAAGSVDKAEVRSVARERRRKPPVS